MLSRRLGWALSLWVSALGCLYGLSARAPLVLEPARGQPSFARPLATEGLGPPGYSAQAARLGRSRSVGPASAASVMRYEVGAPITAAAGVDETGVFVGAHDGVVHGLDHRLQLRYRRPLGGAIRGGVVGLPGGRLAVGTDRGLLHVLGSDGSSSLEYAAGAPIDTAVALDRGLLVAAGREVRALDDSGEVRWSFQARGKVFTTPAIGPSAFDPLGAIYVAAQDHTLYALDHRGVERWRVEVDRDIDGGPMVLPDGRVIVGDDGGKLRCFFPGGEPSWVQDVGGHVRAPLALGAGDTVLVNVHGPRARLIGLDPTDGGLRWEYRFGPADDPSVGSRSGPRVDRDGNVYVGSHDNRLHAVDAGGNPRFVFATGGDIDASPVLGPDGTLYFGSRDGVFYAIRR